MQRLSHSSLQPLDEFDEYFEEKWNEFLRENKDTLKRIRYGEKKKRKDLQRMDVFSKRQFISPHEEHYSWTSSDHDLLLAEYAVFVLNGVPVLNSEGRRQDVHQYKAVRRKGKVGEMYFNCSLQNALDLFYRIDTDFGNYAVVVEFKSYKDESLENKARSQLKVSKDSQEIFDLEWGKLSGVFYVAVYNNQEEFNKTLPIEANFIEEVVYFENLKDKRNLY